MNTTHLEVNGKKYSIFLYLENRTTSSVSIGKTGISIRIPQMMTREDRAKAILRAKLWAKQKLETNPLKEKTIKEYKNGEKLIVGNKEYLLSIKYKPKQSSSAKIKENHILLTISSEISEKRKQVHISTLLSRIIARQRLPELENKIKKLNELHFKQNVNKIFFKNQKSRWGSCSEKGNINISTRLLFAPDDVLAYVCVHELAHLLEFNHSDWFWSLVEKAMPNYKEKEEWLKQNGENLIF